MSELVNNPQKIAEEMAEKHRQDLERQKQEAAVSEWVDHTEDQSLEDFEAYLSTRPSEDSNGSIHDPENGKFTKSNFFDRKREDHYSESLVGDEDGDSNVYEDMSMTQLAKWLGVAEARNDRTTASNIEEALLDKMVDRTEKHNLSQEMQDALQNRMLKLKDEAAEQINGYNARNGGQESGAPEAEKSAEESKPELNEDMLVQLAGLMYELDQEEGKEVLKARTRKAFNIAVDSYAAKHELSDEEKQELKETILEKASIQESASRSEDTEKSETDKEETPAQEAGEQKELSWRQKAANSVKSRWNALQLGIAGAVMGTSGPVAMMRERLRTEEEIEEDEKRNRKALYVGAGILALTGIYYAHQKGYIDVNPFDGNGLDLNPFNNGPESTEGTNGTGNGSDGIEGEANGNGMEGGADTDGGGAEDNGTGAEGHGADSEYGFSGETSVEVQRGSGYTYEIQEIIPGYEPLEYFEAHQAAIEQFGPEYIEGVDYYFDKASGEYRLHPGHGHIPEDVRRFLEDFLKNKK